MIADFADQGIGADGPRRHSAVRKEIWL